MKIQCPNCQKQFRTPDEYEGRKVKCTECKTTFEAHKIDIISEQTKQKLDEIIRKTADGKAKGKSLLNKIWNNSPIVFRNAFLATFGVISALVIAYLFFDWYLVFKNHPSKTNWSSEDVYSITMLSWYAGDFESIQNMRCLICDVISKNPRLFSSMPKVFESMKERLELRAKQLTELKISQNNDNFEKTKNLYIASIYAERDVINDLTNGLKTMNFDSDYEQKIKKANDLASSASFELTTLLLLFDPKMGDAIQNLKK